MLLTPFIKLGAWATAKKIYINMQMSSNVSGTVLGILKCVLLQDETDYWEFDLPKQFKPNAQTYKYANVK